MNPAFTNWWLSQHGGPNAYQDSMIGAPEQDFMQQYNVMPREDVERMGKVVVPGTGGMQEAPKMPSPFPIDPHDMPAMLNSMLTPEEEYERYGTMHGIVPDPNSQYDTQDGPHNGPLDMQGNPVNQGTPSAGPLEKGSAAATQAVGERKRGRYEMDEMQQRRALGAAIMQLFAQRPGASEHETGLTRMAYNMSPATQAYLNEAHNSEKMNADAYKTDQDVRLKERELELKELEINKKGNPEISDYQRNMIESNYNKARREIIRDKNTAIKDYATGLKGVSPKKKQEMIAAKSAELEAQSAAELAEIEEQRAALLRLPRAQHKSKAKTDAVEVPSQLPEMTKKLVDAATVPKTKSGYDFSKLSDEELGI